MEWSSKIISKVKTTRTHCCSIFVAHKWKFLWFGIKTGNRTPRERHDGMIMPEYILVAIENQEYAIQCKWCWSTNVEWIVAEPLELEWCHLVLTKVTNNKHSLFLFQKTGGDFFVAHKWKVLWSRIQTGNRTPGGSHDGIILPEYILVAIENQYYAIQCKWCQSITFEWILVEPLELEWCGLVLTKVTNNKHSLF